MPAISTSSPGSKPCGLERLDHAERAQPLLHVAHRLVVAHVVPRDQALGPLRRAPRRRPGAVRSTRDLVGLARAGRRGGWPAALRPAARRSPSSSIGTRRAMAAASSSSPAPVAAEVASTSPPVRSRHSSTAAATAPAGSEVALREAEQPGQLGQAVPVLAELGLHRRVVGHRVGAVERLQVEHVHQQAAALHVGEELVAQARHPSLAPSIRPGMSASTSWRSPASSVPSTGSSVVKG